MGTVSGAVYLRPARAGMLAKTMTADVVVRASRLACSVWGGMYFPILTNADPKLELASDLLSLDFWYPLDEDGETVALCETPGLRWQGRSPYGPFDQERDGIAMGLLGVDLQFDGTSRSLPVWDDDDPLGPLYGVWLGSYLPGEHGDRLREVYLRGAETVTIPPGGDFPDLSELVTPATATGAGLTYTGEGLGAAVVLVGDDPADFAQVWNARAMGAVVFAWPVAQAHRFEAALRSWLTSAAVQARAGTFQSGDGKQSGRLVSVCPGEGHGHEEAQRVIALVEGAGWSAWLDSSHPGGGWTGHHPVQTDLQTTFSAPVGRDDWHIMVPVPQLAVHRARRRPNWPGFVIADLVVYGETRLPPGRSVSVPAIRRLAPLLGRLSDNVAPLRRPTGEGRAIAVQAGDESVSVGIVPTLALFEELFNMPGWTLGQSDEGRFGTQLVERLGGPRAQTASQPAVRAVLHHASNATRAHPIARFIQEATGARGAWPEPLSTQSPKDYATRVVYWLIERGLLRPALQIRCPQCATETDMRPEDITSDLRCPLCDGAFALGYALATARGSGSRWAYQLAANVPSDRIRSALPVMATLAVISSHRAGMSPAMPHLLGLEVHGPGWDCELDIAAAVIHNYATVVVVGEVKGRMDPIDANDIANLERVRDGLRATGIEAIVVAATSRGSLRPEERLLLRSFCDRAPNRLSRRGSVNLALPVVLVERDISTPWMSEDHPWRWGSPGDPPLAGMAEESCKRNLGLARVEMQPTPTGWGPRPVWADPDIGVTD